MCVRESRRVQKVCRALMQALVYPETMFCKRVKRKTDFQIGRDPQDRRVTETDAGDGAAAGGGLSEWNSAVQRMWDGGETEELPEQQMWATFLWKHSTTKECHPRILMNACHMAGLVLARYRAVTAEVHNPAATLADYIEASPGGQGRDAGRLCLFPDTPVAEYTLRQLRDTVQNLQFLWDAEDAVDVQGIRLGLDACFHRFGSLASAPDTVHVMNDQGSIEDHPCSCAICVVGRRDGTMGGTDKLYQMTRTCLRRFLGAFCMLYRHLYMAENAMPVPSDTPPADIDIKKFHAVAGSDEYSGLSMHWDLFPGAKLNYIHDFPGMFNAVSQVIFYHNPAYQKRMQERDDVEGLSRGDKYEAVHLIPCLMQLYPNIVVAYEEEDFDPRNAPSGDGAGFAVDGYAWIIMGRRVYLLTPQNGGCGNSRVFYDPNTVNLLAFYQRQSAGVAKRKK